MFRGGKRYCAIFIPDSLWVDYCTPGKDLTLAIKKVLNDTRHKFEGLIFLESHGMVATASTLQKCLSLHSDCNKLVKSKFNLNDFAVQVNIEPNLPEYFIFPDQAIYMSPEQLAKKTIACIETVSTVQYLESSFEKLGFTPKKLSIESVKVLNGMASEKYRKKITK